MIINSKKEKRIVYPKTIIVSKEVEDDKWKFEKFLGQMKKLKKYFIPANKIPVKNVTQFISSRYGSEKITLKKDCICNRKFISGDDKGKRACVCEWQIDSEFVKYKNIYGWLLEKKATESNTIWGARLWEELG